MALKTNWNIKELMVAALAVGCDHRTIAKYLRGKLRPTSTRGALYLRMVEDGFAQNGWTRQKTSLGRIVLDIPHKS